MNASGSSGAPGGDAEGRAAALWNIGANVPWSVSWSGEQSFSLQPSRDFPRLMDLVQIERPGHGSPNFAAQHVSRHRRGMVNHLCHVCGQPTKSHDRYIFPIQSGGFVTMPDKSTRYAGTVPPVHLQCAKRAQRLCPHLNSTYAQPLAFPAEASQIMPRTDVVAGMEELAKTLPAGLTVVFTCFRLYGARFSKRVERLRKEYAADAPLEILLKIEKLG